MVTHGTGPRGIAPGADAWHRLARDMADDARDMAKEHLDDVRRLATAVEEKIDAELALAEVVTERDTWQGIAVEAAELLEQAARRHIARLAADAVSAAEVPQ